MEDFKFDLNVLAAAVVKSLDLNSIKNAYIGGKGRISGQCEINFFVSGDYWRVGPIPYGRVTSTDAVAMRRQSEIMELISSHPDFVQRRHELLAMGMNPTMKRDFEFSFSTMLLIVEFDDLGHRKLNA